MKKTKKKERRNYNLYSEIICILHDALKYAEYENKNYASKWFANFVFFFLFFLIIKRKIMYKVPVVAHTHTMHSDWLIQGRYELKWTN